MLHFLCTILRNIFKENVPNPTNKVGILTFSSRQRSLHQFLYTSSIMNIGIFVWSASNVPLSSMFMKWAMWNSIGAIFCMALLYLAVVSCDQCSYQFRSISQRAQYNMNCHGYGTESSFLFSMCLVFCLRNKIGFRKYTLNNSPISPHIKCYCVQLSPWSQ